MQSIDRAMNIIKVLATKSVDNSMSITELSRECELPISSMHRFLKSLMKNELIKQDDLTKRYSLGSIWLAYGLQMYDSMDFVGSIRPELEKLMQKVDESVYLSQPIGLEALIIERIDSEKNQIRVYDQLGTSIPMNIGAANKAMLAHMSYEQAKEIVDSLLPEAERADFWSVLNETKAKGYGISHGERTEGTTSVAAPILNTMGEVQGAVSIGFVSFNLTQDRLNFLTSEVIQAGRRISAKLGYHGSWLHF